MNPNQLARLAELDARLSAHLVDFRAKEDESHALRNAALASAAGTAAALGGLYARGRLARNRGKWGTATIRDADGGFGGMREVLRTARNDIRQGASATGRGLRYGASTIASAARQAAHSTGLKRYSMLPAVIK